MLPPKAASIYVGCSISQDITTQFMGYMKLSVAQHSTPWVSKIQKHIFFSQANTSEGLFAPRSKMVVNRTSLSAYLLVDGIGFSQLFGAEKEGRDRLGKRKKAPETNKSLSGSMLICTRKSSECVGSQYYTNN